MKIEITPIPSGENKEDLSGKISRDLLEYAASFLDSEYSNKKKALIKERKNLKEKLKQLAETRKNLDRTREDLDRERKIKDILYRISEAGSFGLVFNEDFLAMSKNFLKNLDSLTNVELSNYYEAFLKKNFGVPGLSK
jgi:hypothetical protein